MAAAAVAVLLLAAAFVSSSATRYGLARNWAVQVTEALDGDDDDGTGTQPLFAAGDGAEAEAAALAAAPGGCAEPPLPASHWSLAKSPAARRLLAMYGQVHQRQLGWLRTGSRRFRAVLYRCRGTGADNACGGLGDRLNGIVSSFYLAVMTQRAFFIDHATPLPLAVFLEPSLAAVNWTWPPDGWDAYAASAARWAGGAEEAEINAVDSYARLDAQLREPGSNPLLALNAYPTVLAVRTNLQFWMAITASAEYAGRSPFAPLVQPVRDAGELVATALAGLLRPSCYLANETSAWEARLFGVAGGGGGGGGGTRAPAPRRIGVHLRTGLDPSFWDQHRVLDNDLAPFAHRLPALVRELAGRLPEPRQPPPAVLLITDYPPVVDGLLAALRAPPAANGTGFAAVATLPINDALPLTHIERTDANVTKTEVGNLRTFLEWNLLRRMDALVFGVSGYSMSVARALCTPSLLYPNITADLDQAVYYPRGLCLPPAERPTPAAAEQRRRHAPAYVPGT